MFWRRWCGLFLDQKRRKKSDATYKNYKHILGEFVDQLPASVRFIDQVNADVLDSHMRYLESEKAAPKTISNKMMVVSFMLKAAGVATPSKMMELPTVEEEIPEPYTREDLQALFKAMTPEERVRYTFFLDTACREKEVAHAQWADLIDGKYWVRKKTFKARGGKERQFSPKSHETRLIPLTRELMDMLNARRKSSKSQRIFPNEWGDPEGHFLRKFKAVAKEAGLNCGECETTISEGRFTKHPAEVSCLTRPVCEKHYLHRLRKTCATFWHEKHIPIRTIQYWLGHKSLETTQKSWDQGQRGTTGTDQRAKILSAAVADLFREGGSHPAFFFEALRKPIHDLLLLFGVTCRQKAVPAS